MNEELVKLAYVLGYEAGLEKSALPSSPGLLKLRRILLKPVFGSKRIARFLSGETDRRIESLVRHLRRGRERIWLRLQPEWKGLYWRRQALERPVVEYSNARHILGNPDLMKLESRLSAHGMGVPGSVEEVEKYYEAVKRRARQIHLQNISKNPDEIRELGKRMEAIEQQRDALSRAFVERSSWGRVQKLVDRRNDSTPRLIRSLFGDAVAGL